MRDSDTKYLHQMTRSTSSGAVWLKGFFVEMPLEWGIRERVTPKPPLEDPGMIAKNDIFDKHEG